MGCRENIPPTIQQEDPKGLRVRVHEIRSNTFIGQQAERVTVANLIDDYFKHYGSTGKKAMAQVSSNSSRVVAAFGEDRAIDVNTARIRDYVAGSVDSGLAPATTNRGLQVLRAAFRLAVKEDRPTKAPYFPMLPEKNARTGFFERAEHEAINEVGELIERRWELRQWAARATPTSYSTTTVGQLRGTTSEPGCLRQL